MKIVILAGGLGQRLWPLSRQAAPKQIRPFLGKQTLLQKTVTRLKRRFASRNIFIVTGREYAGFIRRQLPAFPKSNLLIEPARRNTAAAIGLGAYRLIRSSPDETMINIASDHHIADEAAFLKHLELMDRVVTRDPLAVCLAGIRPTYPETGYGYILAGGLVGRVDGLPLYTVRQFVEKPDRKRAAGFLKNDKYFWNPAYFAWRPARVRELYQKFAPQTHLLLERTLAGDAKAFAKISPEPVDTAILEKLNEHFYILPATFGWADVGHWKSVKDIRSGRSGQTVTLGLHHGIDTYDSLVYNYTDSLVATLGVRDLIIVQTEVGTLICHRDRAQDVRQLVQAMKEKKRLRKYL